MKGFYEEIFYEPVYRDGAYDERREEKCVVVVVVYIILLGQSPQTVSLFTGYPR